MIQKVKTTLKKVFKCVLTTLFHILTLGIKLYLKNKRQKQMDLYLEQLAKIKELKKNKQFCKYTSDNKHEIWQTTNPDGRTCLGCNKREKDIKNGK